MVDPVFRAILLLVMLGALCGLFILGVRHPHKLLYTIIAFAPTQFLFIPVSDFFTSPADLLVVCGGAAFILRSLRGRRATWRSVKRHVLLSAVVGAYIVGFVVLGFYSRNLVRLPLAVVPSLLAVELLRRPADFEKAAVALIVAGVIDAAYGLAFYLRGISVIPGRFSGMSGVNFSAMVILTAAAVAYAKSGASRGLVAALGAGVLAGFGLATQSVMGIAGFLASWLGIVWRAVSGRSKVFVVVAVISMPWLVLSQDVLRSAVLASYYRAFSGGPTASLTSWDIRWALTRTAWAAFRDSPIFGIGFSRFIGLSTNDPGIAAYTQEKGLYTHNTYIGVLVEGGLIAAVPFFLHFAQYWSVWRSARGRIRQDGGRVFAYALAGLPVALIVGLGNDLLLNYSFWGICGVALASRNLLRKDRDEGRPPLASHEQVRA